MEVEIKPISLDARLEYLQAISENKNANVKKFPWLIAMVALLIGGGLVVAVNQYRIKKQKKSTAN